jgi:hypothetical protein
MALLEPELPETRERCCPACQSVQIEPVSHVMDAGGLVVRPVFT